MSANTYRPVSVIDPISVTLDPANGSITLQECNGDEMAAMVTISASTWPIIVREVARAMRELARGAAEGGKRG